MYRLTYNDGRVQLKVAHVLWPVNGRSHALTIRNVDLVGLVNPKRKENTK
jgi:hypothetical protein